MTSHSSKNDSVARVEPLEARNLLTAAGAGVGPRPQIVDARGLGGGAAVHMAMPSQPSQATGLANVRSGGGPQGAMRAAERPGANGGPGLYRNMVVVDPGAVMPHAVVLTPTGDAIIIVDVPAHWGPPAAGRPTPRSVSPAVQENPPEPAQAPVAVAPVAPPVATAVNAQGAPNEAKVAANSRLDEAGGRQSVVPPAASAVPVTNVPATKAAPVVTGVMSLTRSVGAFSTRLITPFVAEALPRAVEGATAMVGELAAVSPAAPAIVAAAVEAAPRLFQFAQINWALALANPWGDLAEESASLPLATVEEGNTRAWVITGAVATFDVVLAGWYVSRRARRKRAVKWLDMKLGAA